MKIVTLSDLNWEQHLRSVSLSEVDRATVQSIMIPRYYSIQRYLEIVLEEEADLVLFAGDVTGDGTCGHGFHNAFKIFLSILEQLKIPSCFISGNHDEPVYYEEVVRYSESLKYATDINNQSKEINGIRILGIPYETTVAKGSIQKALEQFGERHDIILAHSQLKRRIRLFELDTEVIVTGHYDRKLFRYQDTTFISLDNDETDISYAVLKSYFGGYDVSFCVRRSDEVTFRLTDESATIGTEYRTHALTVNDQPVIDLRKMELHANEALVDAEGDSMVFMKYLRGDQYLKLLRRLHQVAADSSLRPTASVMSHEIGMQITANYKVSESLVVDFLGKRTR